MLNHICQSRIKVACKVAKSFLTLFPVTLVKVEVQESNLYQMNQKKVYFLTCFVQNVQKFNMVGCRALNGCPNHYGPPCKYPKEESHSSSLCVYVISFWSQLKTSATILPTSRRRRTPPPLATRRHFQAKQPAQATNRASPAQTHCAGARNWDKTNTYIHT